MRANEFLNEEESYTPPTLHTGDVVMKGKFKNSPAEIKGFKKDKHNQPVLKTNKGDVQLFKPRITKLMKEEIIDEYDMQSPATKQITSKLKSLGYKMLGSGQDATVWTKDEASVIKILMPAEEFDDPEIAEKTFLTFYEFCQSYPSPHLPKFIDVGGQHHTVFELNGMPYRQIAMERLAPIKNNTFEEAMVWMMSDMADTDYYERWDRFSTHILEADWSNIDSSIGEQMPELILAKMRDKGFRDTYLGLFMVMRNLWDTGRANKLGWDLHTKNVMQRRDGTLVVVDPWWG
jgi:hypothetical protein